MHAKNPVLCPVFGSPTCNLSWPPTAEPRRSENVFSSAEEMKLKGLHTQMDMNLRGHRHGLEVTGGGKGRVVISSDVQLPCEI
jgi:hypothetical protein